MECPRPRWSARRGRSLGYSHPVRVFNQVGEYYSLQQSPGWEEVRGTYLLCMALANAALCLAIGTNLQYAHCPSGSVNASCQAAFLGIHLTPKSSAYFEVRGVAWFGVSIRSMSSQGTWVWTADHDLDGSGQTSVFTGRGILSESAGPVWLIGTCKYGKCSSYLTLTLISL
jgi:hypothetical protein